MSKHIEPKRPHQPAKQNWMNPTDPFFGDDFLSFDNWPSLTRNSVPAVKETDAGYSLSANLAGIPKEDIHVSVSGNRLTIRAEHSDESGEKGGDYSSQFRSYHQSFTLPSDVNADQIEAHCEHGRLDIFLPKIETAEGRQVEVQSGKKGFLSRMLGKSEKKEKDQH